jgi:hypothetical protein
MARKTSGIRIALPVAIAAVVLALAPTALAGKPTHGGSGGSCTPAAPSVLVQNTWGWAKWGSFGLPGQRLTYMVQIVDNDVGCAGSNFTLGVSAPSGFSVSIPTSTISLKPGTSSLPLVYVTSPTGVADGDYALNFTAQRAGLSGSSTSYYKLYSSDTVAPTLYWPSLSEGQTISGRSFRFSVSAYDDHAVSKIDLSIDNALVSSTSCAGISYSCSFGVDWSLSGRTGQHTATFRSYDWLGNVGVMTVHFTVG